MKLEHVNRIIEWLASQGHSVLIYENYSGKLMYGDETTGIIVPDESIVSYAIGTLNAGEPASDPTMISIYEEFFTSVEEESPSLETARNADLIPQEFRVDDLGRSRICY